MDLETELLDDMINTTDQTKYLKLYEKLTKQQAVNKQNAQTVEKLKYSFQNQRYEDIVNTLNDYKSNFDDVVNKNRVQRPLKNFNFLSQILPITPAQLPRTFIDAGMALYDAIHFYNVPDAKEMWKAASHDFLLSKNYIEKNGSLIYSIADLPNKDLQIKIEKKLENQLGIKDAIGTIYNSSSDLSKEISTSPELKEHFLKNKDRILRREVVKGGSANVQSNDNLSKALPSLVLTVVFLTLFSLSESSKST